MQRTLFETPPVDGLAFDFKFRRRGFRLLAGVDEVGRGPLAGPVVAAAVILPEGMDLPGVVDSKRVPPARREELAKTIRQAAVSVGVGLVDAEEIDRTNILRASLKAMVRAIRSLDVTPDFVLIDGPYTLPLSIPQRSIIKGDALSLSIAAASIVAKVHRDQLMLTYHEQYPFYGFARHKGYPTREHLRALRRFGPCPIHRRSFHGVCCAEDAAYGPPTGSNRP
ncbi:ribonuclease HII [Desulfosoma caldarium]|uniref:Ribonuclease HII n=1 Tax=Desulfosoma caldarium TaxID=610254 RepID=A0A3N1VKT9_9BACT|nr:ribonuclease HII [Desulfosoma caldarium]ROR01618.1 RNase HII [Desulfosoma caldarium]